MLAGKKPLAHFSDAHPQEPNEEIIPLEAFAPYVANGRFVMRQFVSFLRIRPPVGYEHIRGVLNVLYARPSEEWRIDAYCLMLSVSDKAGWSEGFERMQGSLLGYEEWQSDLHMAELRADERLKNSAWVHANAR
jgi:hypothetical protein